MINWYSPSLGCILGKLRRWCQCLSSLWTWCILYLSLQLPGLWAPAATYDSRNHRNISAWCLFNQLCVQLDQSLKWLLLSGKRVLWCQLWDWKPAFWLNALGTLMKIEAFSWNVSKVSGLKLVSENSLSVLSKFGIQGMKGYLWNPPAMLHVYIVCFLSQGSMVLFWWPMSTVYPPTSSGLPVRALTLTPSTWCIQQVCVDVWSGVGVKVLRLGAHNIIDLSTNDTFQCLIPLSFNTFWISEKRTTSLQRTQQLTLYCSQCVLYSEVLL